MIQTMESYAAAFRSGFARAYVAAQGAPSAAEAAAACDRLEGLDPAGQRAHLRGLPPALVVALFGEIAQRARRGWVGERGTTPGTAELLFRCARAARGPALPKALRADLRAEAWALVANDLRLAERYREAEGAWRRARVLLNQGSGDTQLLAELAWLQAALRRDQRLFVAARDLLQLARRQYERIQDRDGLGRVQLSSAILRFTQGDTEGAYEEALDLLKKTDGEKRPERAVRSMHLIWDCYIDRGEYDLALEWYHLYERFYAELGGILQVRADWLKGRLCVGLGKWSAAETYFERLRGEFLTRGLEFDAALVGVELALCRAEQRDLAGVRRLVEEMYPVFCSKKLPQEAAATLILFANTARAFRLKVAQLADLGAEIKTLARSFGR